MAFVPVQPCPFCGHTGIQITENKYREFSARCQYCSAQGPLTISYTRAGELWNVRKH